MQERKKTMTKEEYLKTHLLDMDEAKKRWYINAMENWTSEDYDRYTQTMLWMMQRPKGKITVTPIPQDLLDKYKKLPKKNRTIEETGRFAAEVFKRCFHYEGDPVDVSKLPKDYDDDELNYDPEHVYKPRLKKKSKKPR